MIYLVSHSSEFFILAFQIWCWIVSNYAEKSPFTGCTIWIDMLLWRSLNVWLLVPLIGCPLILFGLLTLFLLIHYFFTDCLQLQSFSCPFIRCDSVRVCWCCYLFYNYRVAFFSPIYIVENHDFTFNLLLSPLLSFPLPFHLLLSSLEECILVFCWPNILRQSYLKHVRERYQRKVKFWIIWIWWQNKNDLQNNQV